MDGMTAQWFKKHDRILLVGFLCAVCLLLTYRLLHLIDLYAVDLLFKDEWRFDEPLFRGLGWLAMFRQQNGPHRQGLGLFITGPLASLTGWNMRAESFAIAVIVLAALVAAFVLKWRLWGEWNWSDVALPLLFLTPTQFETFFGTPNPAHSALPLLLLMLYCLAWLARKRSVRYGGIVVLNFCMIYTGFGIFIGVITPVLLAVEWWRERRKQHASEASWVMTALLLALLSAGSFLIGYKFNPSAEHFQAVHPRPWEYPWFAALLSIHYFGVNIVGNLIPATVLGIGLLLLILAVGVIHARLWLQTHSEISLIITILISFALLYCLDTAYGRISFGLEGAQASRYATLVIPAYLGLYLHALTIQPQRPRLVWLLLTLAALARGCLLITPTEGNQMIWYRGIKQRWEVTYLQTGNVEEANRQANFQIYPDTERDSLAWKLDYLRQHHLNLFRNR